MISARQCSRPSCSRAAAATLTYVYADSTVVVGVLAATAEPHSYDLCAFHAEKFTAPRGWEVVHIVSDYVEAGPSEDDIDALARAVREAGTPAPAPTYEAPQPRASEPRRGHLRVISAESSS